MRAKCGKNSGKMREEFGQNSGENSGKRWRGKIKKRQQNIRAKFGRKFGQTWRGKKLRNDSKKNRANSLEENGKLIVLFENNSQELARIYVLGLAQILLIASARITLHIP